MKTSLMVVVLLVLACGVTSAMAGLMPVVEDNFNSYANGSIVGQGSWRNRATGDNFVVQGTAVFEGAKALYITGVSDSVIVQEGTNLTDGMQTFYVKTENRNTWAEYSRIDFRMLRGGWDSGIFCDVALQWNGKVEYVGKDMLYHTFTTYSDNEWTKIDIEWRSVDISARYRANDELWTDWSLFSGGSSFAGFDNVGIDFSLMGGSSSGGAYFDTVIPEPATIGLLALGAVGLLRRKR